MMWARAAARQSGAVQGRIQTRFYVALILMLLGALTIAGVGVVGLATVSSHASRIYADNLVTAEFTSQVRASMEETHETALEIALTTDPAARRSLRRELDLKIIPDVDAGLAQLMQLHAADTPAERDEVSDLVTAWSRVKDRLAEADVGSASGPRALDAPELAAVFDPIFSTVTAMVARESGDAREGLARTVASRHNTQLAIGLLSIAVLLVGIAAAMSLVRSVRRTLSKMSSRRARELETERRQAEFTDALQAADDEHEANGLLKRHLERSIPGSSVVVFNRNNSADRLTAMTDLSRQTPLASGLEGAEPRSCLAVRFGRPYLRDPDQEPLLACRVCHALEGSLCCEPLVVGGEVIGSVLMERDGTQIEPQDLQRVHVSVSQAAPVLANLRSLAVAEARAATDALTGMPNRRSVQDTLNRMVAQASRTLTPLTAVMIDLDHFKKINDTFGHGKGDETLAQVGAVLQSSLRASDFVGRYGGEEFLALLPNTPRDAGVGVAEKLRMAIAQITVPQVDREVTVSLGVATFPDDAVDPGTLVRGADRALYAAKAGGRNRVEAFSLDPSETIASPPVRA
jgi:diguanylate cyclase (GGDEF)-like protein